MNLLPVITKRAMRKQHIDGRHFLLGAVIVLLVVLGPGAGNSISKTEDPGTGQVAISAKSIKAPTHRNDQLDIKFRQKKERADRRQIASVQQTSQFTIDPEKRKKLAFLLLLTGGQVHTSRL